ncbi:MAG: polyprenol monophosphomannose synthase [Chloroflexota bacterium]|nr:polyprenol monophosphomannose synthase [Chloroflexota bacterium]
MASIRTIVILPTYNEKENIESITNKILKFDEISVVVVDDESPDGTGAIADELAAVNSDRIHFIHRKERGRASAGFVGFAYALAHDADYVIEMDADFSHNPADIPRLLNMAREYDVVIGSRYAPGGKDAERTLVREVISKIASLYTRLLLGRPIQDWSGGYKCYSKQALASLGFSKFHSGGYAVGMETLYRLSNNGYSIVEIPITFQDKRLGRSKFSWHHIVEYFHTSVKLRFRQNL